MTHTLYLPLKLPTLNEYIRAERGNRYQAAKLKKDTQQAIGWYIRSQLGGVKLSQVHLHYTWVEVNKKRDKDNVAFAKKFVQDALVEMGVLPNDGWANVTGFSDSFEIGEDVAVKVELEEV